MKSSQIRFAVIFQLVLLCGWVLSGCGASNPKNEGTTVSVKTKKQEPPSSGTPREVRFPEVKTETLPNGLKLLVAELKTLPIVYSQLVIEAGSIHDPASSPGLSSLVSSMVKEGTQKMNSAQLAERVEFLGADLWATGQKEFSTVGIQSLSEHFEETLSILSDVVRNPKFDKKEFAKLKKRELARLSLAEADPSFLARREAFKALYGNHQYSHVDTTSQVVQKIKIKALRQWHQSYYKPTNSFLVIVGDVKFEDAKQSVLKSFGSWKGKYPKPPELAELPVRDTREVILIDRPESVQTVIRIGNLALQRQSGDWIPLLVANQVLGGTAASRLFMDLREKRSLTYGAYSGVGEFWIEAPFQAMTSCRNEVTAEAMEAMFLQLEDIVSKQVPEEELKDAKRYLSDSFPLKIDSARKIVDLITEKKFFNLSEDYWTTYRNKIDAVTSEQALEVAKKYIQPGNALIVVVGKAAQILEPLRKYGPVRVLDPQGRLKQTFEQLPSVEPVK